MDAETQQETELFADQKVSRQGKFLVKSTCKVQQNYETDIEELLGNVNQLWSKTVDCILCLSQPSYEVMQLEGALKQCIATYESCKRLCLNYTNLLKRYNTEELTTQEELKGFD